MEFDFELLRPSSSKLNDQDKDETKDAKRAPKDFNTLLKMAEELRASVDALTIIDETPLYVSLSLISCPH